MLDHLVDLELARANVQRSELAKQKNTIVETKWPEFEAACTKATSKSRVECALAATDHEAVAKCDDAQ